MSIAPGSENESDAQSSRPEQPAPPATATQPDATKPLNSTAPTEPQQPEQQQTPPSAPASSSTALAADQTPAPVDSNVASSDAAKSTALSSGLAAAPLSESLETCAPANPAAPEPAPSSTSADQTNAPTKASKPKTPRQPGSASKPKQKRRSNQAGAKDSAPIHTGPSTAGGTIGAASDHAVTAMLSSGGGGRKALPELVLPFKLPCSADKPPYPLLDNASSEEKEAYRKAAKMNDGSKKAVQSGTPTPAKGIKSRSRQIKTTGENASDYSDDAGSGSDSDSDTSSDDDENDDEDDEERELRRAERKRKREPASIEDSLVMLQSLRQSRLSHLSSLLPPFSQRVRSGMVYPNVLPSSLLHGLNPREPHVLIQLGRADIHIGPHVFVKTKFWEVRPDVEINSSSSTSKTSSGGATGPFGESLHLKAADSKADARNATSTKKEQPTAKPTGDKPRPPSKNGSDTQSNAPSKTGTESTKAPATPAPRPANPSTVAVSTPRPIAPKPSAAPAAGIPAAVSSTNTAAAPSAPTKSSTPSKDQATPVPQVQTPSQTASPAPKFTPVSLPRPPIVQPTSAKTPSLPKPPTLHQGSSPQQSQSQPQRSAPRPPLPASTTVSQHVQFAPQRLSPISQGPAGSQPQTPNGGAKSGSGVATPSPPTQAAATATTSTASSTPPTTTGAPVASTAAASTPTPVAPKPQNGTAASGTTTATTPTSSKAPAASGPTTTPTTTSTATTSTVRPVPPPRQLQPTPAQPKPPAAGAQPAIDAVLVSRVNATAALNPELQQLLHVAASGKASPEQLKSLGVWIQAITAQLREDEAKAAASAAAAADTAKSAVGQKGKAAAGKDAASSSQGEKPKKGRKSKADADPNAKAAKKAAKAEEREAKKKAAAAAKAEAKAAAAAQKQAAAAASAKTRPLPPGWPTDGPPRPPIIVVEFRENPSMRFVLPLWKCLVERKEGVDPTSMPKIKKEARGFFDSFDDDDDEDQKGVEPELKLSFFVPSIGSDAAGRSGIKEILDEEKRKAEERSKKDANAALAPPAEQGPATPSSTTNGGPTENSPTVSAPAAPLASNTAALTETEASPVAPKKLSKKAQKALEAEAKAKAAADLEDANLPKKHEQYPATWTIKGGVTESMWEAFGRIPGCTTSAVVRPIKVEPDIELAPDVAEFLVPEIKYHLLDQPEEELKIQKETTNTFIDLFHQMPERRYLLPCIPPVQIPSGLEEHLADKFAIRPQAVSVRPVAKRKAGLTKDDGDLSFALDGFGSLLGDANGVKTEATDTPPKPPKRKRHVATHNPDGSIKSCGACGKTKTPMWRRGPKGPSQLCNACGARWKAGRLVVPEVAPPPIIETEEDRAREEKEKQAKLQAKQAAQAAKAQQAMIKANQNGKSNANGARSMPGLVSGQGAVFIPVTPPMPTSSFGSMSGLDLSQGPSPYSAQAHASLPMTTGSDSYSLVGIDSGGFGPEPMGLSMGMGLSGIPGSTRPSPSPFIHSPNPHEGPESMPASVDPSVLFGSGTNSRSSSF